MVFADAGCQGSLQRAGEKHGVADDAVCAEQCVDGAKTFAGGTGVSASAHRASARMRPEKAPKYTSNALKFSETAARVSSNEFSNLNSCCGGRSADLPSLKNSFHDPDKPIESCRVTTKPYREKTDFRTQRLQRFHRGCKSKSKTLFSRFLFCFLRNFCALCVRQVVSFFDLCSHHESQVFFQGPVSFVANKERLASWVTFTNVRIFLRWSLL